jgi:hypothetical protein
MMGLYLQQQAAAYVEVSEVHNSTEIFKDDFSDDPSKANKFYTQLITNGNRR